jgi:hypothetical protein
MYGCE